MWGDDEVVSRTPVEKLPVPGAVVADTVRSEVILSAKVQFPEGKPCINAYGQRIQAFAGCAKAAAGDAKMARYFVFLVDVSTEQVFEALMQVGCRPKVHYSIQEGRKRSGLTPKTRPKITCRATRSCCLCSGRTRKDNGSNARTSISLRSR